MNFTCRIPVRLHRCFTIEKPIMPTKTLAKYCSLTSGEKQILWKQGEHVVHLFSTSLASTIRIFSLPEMHFALSLCLYSTQPHTSKLRELIFHNNNHYSGNGVCRLNHAAIQKHTNIWANWCNPIVFDWNSQSEKERRRRKEIKSNTLRQFVF